MNRKSAIKIIIDDILLVAVSSFMVLLLIFIFPQFSSPTDDGNDQLFNYLEQGSGGQVLGANSEDNNYCPEDKPIIGWVDYRGNKIITNTLPNTEKPSVCFETTIEANQQEFFQK